jgi:hypothetical protein
LDGSHIHSAPPASKASKQAANRNWKGFVSQNCLFSCSFDLTFVYVLSGWEGLVTDACLWEDAQMHDLIIPDGKYYLTDAGFPQCQLLLVPYHGVQHHLAEWGCASTR